tara:strand:+ start:384 stop:1196 length:813 start_codon:yes stop_codon:yes gene_type:complete
MFKSLQRITGPATQLVSTADAKAQLRVDDSDEDSLIDALVKAATEKLEEHCRQAFIEQTWQITLAEFPAAGVELPRPPLVGVEKVSYWPDLASTVLRGRGAKLVVSTSPSDSATIDRVLTGLAYNLRVTDSKLAFEDVELTSATVGASSTSFTGIGGLSAGTYYVDYCVDAATVWSTFKDWDVAPFDFPPVITPRTDDLPDLSSEKGPPWRINYKAGYGTATGDVPEAIIAAVKGLMTHLFEHRGEDPRQVPIPDFISYIVSHLVVPHKL